MTDVTTNTASTATTAPEQLNTTPAPVSDAPKTDAKATKLKSKPKRRTRQRRRAATSDNESSANEGGDQSDSSASLHSDHPDSEDEEEAEAEVIEDKQPSVFPDVSSITPAGWTKKEENQESISFEDFAAGKEPPAVIPARGTGMAIRGRGKGKVDAGSKREYTPEETARYEAQKAKRKEKQKAKKAELREKAIKNKEAKGKAVPKAAEVDTPAKEPSASVNEKPTPAPQTASKPPPAQPTKHKAKKQTESTPASYPVAEVTASTSAFKLDDPAPEAPKAAEAAPVPAETEQPAVESQRGVELLPNGASSTAEPADDQPQRGPRGNQREAYAQRMAEDPKFTPRVGQFWTHDQRLYEGGNVGDGYSGLRQMSPFWRGRGIPRGAFRGGMRGRGRGGFFPNGRGGAVNINNGPPRPVELSQEESKEEGGSKLAMDREFELAEARDKARSTTQASVPIESPGSETAPPVVRPPVAPMAERKWGHEAYETMGSGDQFRGGRGRGRVMRARGGHFPRVHHLPFHPSAIAAQNAAAARAAALAAGSTPPVTASTEPATESTPAAPKAEEPTSGEALATQPDAESLLDTGDDSFKVKFPGSQATVVPAAPPAPTVPVTAPESTTPAAPAAPVTIAKEVSHEAQYPTIHSSSPGPVAAFQAQMYTGGSSNSPFPNGSENGSAGSGHFARSHPGQFYAPGMNASGEFVPSHMQPQTQHQSPQHQHPHQQQHRPPFHPQSRPQMPPQAYSPQFHPSSPYSPGPYDSHAGPSYGGPSPGPGGPPMASPQGGFYSGPGNCYANGRSSPLNPYMVNNNQVGGYFSPARSASKVAIRAPRPGQDGSEGQSQAQANGTSPPVNGQSQQHQQQQGGTYYPQHYNPYVQPFVPGQGQGQHQHQRQETVYYPGPNDQQFGWQGYGEQGYYDANGAYGY